MGQITITGDFKEEDIWLIAKFFREFWKHREEKIFMSIEEGTAHLTTEQVQGIFRKIFSDDKDWSNVRVDDNLIKEFKKSIK